MDSVWVLTCEVNEYNQCGEYFVAVFKNKPTSIELTLDCDVDLKTAEHISNGGGRLRVEHTWYFLREHRFGDFNKGAASGS